jgi:zinc-binding alcohol dehydrogenase/oxidoreductase
MKAAVLDQHNYKLIIKEVALPAITNSQVLVKLKAVSLNHHELWSLQERTLSAKNDIIMGSDGAGVVVEVGSSVNDVNIGDEVVINPSINWGKENKVQGSKYEILGHPTQGTFAEFIGIDSKYVYKKPSHLSFEEAAAIPLAGLTAYRALFSRGGVEKGDSVLITGIGGGAALFALSFAVANKHEVFVTSGSDQKVIKAIELGAQDGVNYKNNNWDTLLREKVQGFDVIIDSAAGDGFAKLVELANSGGRIALFGRTNGQISSVRPSAIFWKQLSIHGTTMGNDEEFKKMMEYVSKHKIHPVIDSVYPFKKITEGFDKMQKGLQFGKIVINLNQ